MLSLIAFQSCLRGSLVAQQSSKSKWNSLAQEIVETPMVMNMDEEITGRNGNDSASLNRREANCFKKFWRSEGHLSLMAPKQRKPPPHSLFQQFFKKILFIYWFTGSKQNALRNLSTQEQLRAWDGSCLKERKIMTKVSFSKIGKYDRCWQLAGRLYP